MAFQISRIGSGQDGFKFSRVLPGHPDLTRPDAIRPDPARPDPTRPDPTRDVWPDSCTTLEFFRIERDSRKVTADICFVLLQFLTKRDRLHETLELPRLSALGSRLSLHRRHSASVLEQPKSDGGGPERMLPGASRRPDAYLPHAPQGAAGARRRGRPVSKRVALTVLGLVGDRRRPDRHRPYVHLGAWWWRGWGLCCGWSWGRSWCWLWCC